MIPKASSAKCSSGSLASKAWHLGDVYMRVTPGSWEKWLALSLFHQFHFFSDSSSLVPAHTENIPRCPLDIVYLAHTWCLHNDIINCPLFDFKEHWGMSPSESDWALKTLQGNLYPDSHGGLKVQVSFLWVVTENFPPLSKFDSGKLWILSSSGRQILSF